jgi:hypothetical protein
MTNAFNDVIKIAKVNAKKQLRQARASEERRTLHMWFPGSNTAFSEAPS